MQLSIIYADLMWSFVLPKIKNQKFMFHSSGQIKAFMTSKHNTFENNVMFHFDRKTVLQYEKKKKSVFACSEGKR